VRDEEHEHFVMLGEAIRQLGGDPTVVTPSANLQATASKGLCAVLADPRTDVLQCLEALLTAELVDNDCWPALIELVENAGEEDLAARFQASTGDRRPKHSLTTRTVASILCRGNGRRRMGSAQSHSEPAKARGVPSRRPSPRWRIRTR
jgi:hypothetical protein